VALLTAALAATPTTAGADGDVSVRGAYYKERSTRVTQPMIDARLDVGERGELIAHAVVDAITSASAAVGASAGTPFDKTRYELGGGYLHRFLERFAAGGVVRMSLEPDYSSFFFTARGSAELAQRNTLLVFALSQGRDHITNGNAQGGPAAPVEGNLDTTLVSGSVSQVLSPLWVGAFTYDFIYLHGFQQNPYRTVSAGGLAVAEREPDIRLRHAIAASVRTYIPPTDTVVIGSYRFYADSWGIVGHTPELRLIQQITENLFVQARYRYYWQNAADFSQPTYATADPTIQPFLTDDPKLAAMTTHVIGGKIELTLAALGFDGLTGRMRTELLLEYLIQNNRFGNAIHAQFALTVPFDY
jgi:hypothetical protein